MKKIWNAKLFAKAMIDSWPMVLVAVLLAVMAVMASGCKSQRAYSWHENGRMATASYDDGFIEWSDGPNKRLPFSEINVNGVGM